VRVSAFAEANLPPDATRPSRSKRNASRTAGTL